MKKLKYIWIGLLAISLLSCSDSSTGSETEVEEASSQKQFVWNAMNFWYYWQGDVQQLGDNYFDNDAEFNSYLNSYSSAEEVFYSLLHNEDDFSFFIEDYEEFNQSQQGISESFGYEYGLVRIEEGQPEIFGYVQYVLDDSPADQAGLVRGDIFTSVNGTQLTVNNYQDLLQGTTSYELTLAVIEDNTINETDETVSLQAETLTEDPIYYTTVFDTSATKVGYLMYNAFQTNSHQDLNDVIGNFSSENIDELVLDLRYNGGGSGATSQTLSSMISGEDSSSVFAQYAYNSKRSEQLNRTINFVEELGIYEDNERVGSEPLNTLSLDRVYVLTGFGTASASEVLINGLEPYMDEVVLIGRQTVGKDEGSYTLYDTPEPPYWEEENANPDHKNAIQPIVLKVVNVDGREYPDGFTPAEENQVNEIGFLEGGLPPIGDPDEPLLGRALELITGQQNAKLKQVTPIEVGEPFKDSRDLKPYGKRLYIEPVPDSEMDF